MLMREIIMDSDLAQDHGQELLLESKRRIKAGWNTVKRAKPAKPKRPKPRRLKAVKPLASVIVRPPKPIKWP
jgi:hypothetical protein